MTPSDTEIRNLLAARPVVALVGFSQNPDRASNYVGDYMRAAGFRVIPINPGLAGQQHLGETVYASLADIPKDISVGILNIFRRSDQVVPVVEEGLAELADLRCVWMQMGIANRVAAAKTLEKGLMVVQDRCIKVEHARLIG